MTDEGEYKINIQDGEETTKMRIKVICTIKNLYNYQKANFKKCKKMKSKIYIAVLENILLTYI